MQTHNEDYQTWTRQIFNKHLLMGYLFLALVFVGAVSSVYYWEDKERALNQADATLQSKTVESGEQAPGVEGAVCAQVMTTARHKDTGELREFPSPCHVPIEYWEVVK